MPHTTIRLDRAALRRLRPSEVLQRRWPNPALPQQWFRLLDVEQPVLVGPCGHFFEAEEFEMVSNGWGGVLMTAMHAMDLTHLHIQAAASGSLRSNKVGCTKRASLACLYSCMNTATSFPDLPVLHDDGIIPSVIHWTGRSSRDMTGCCALTMHTHAGCVGARAGSLFARAHPNRLISNNGQLVSRPW